MILKRITGDSITTIVGILVASLGQLVPVVLGEEYHEVGLQVVTALGGLALAFAGDKSKTEL